MRYITCSGHCKAGFGMDPQLGRSLPEVSPGPQGLVQDAKLQIPVPSQQSLPFRLPSHVERRKLTQNLSPYCNLAGTHPESYPSPTGLQVLQAFCQQSPTK